MYKINKFIILFLILLIPLANAKHSHKECYYQNIWCDEHHGITEYILYDKTRVDCLTKDYAVEFDFAHKWAESVGQALYYSKMTNKKPAIVLIMESSDDERYFERANILAKSYNITIDKMKSDDYDNYIKTFDIFNDFIAYIKSLIKMFLINIVDML